MYIFMDVYVAFDSLCAIGSLHNTSVIVTGYLLILSLRKTSFGFRFIKYSFILVAEFSVLLKWSMTGFSHGLLYTLR